MAVNAQHYPEAFLVRVSIYHLPQTKIILHHPTHLPSNNPRLTLILQALPLLFFAYLLPEVARLSPSVASDSADSSDSVSAVEPP